RLRPHEVVQEPQRLAIPPLQVVGDEEERPTRRQDRPRGRVEEPRPLIVLRQRIGAREGWQLGAELRQQAAELREPRSVEAPQPAPDRLGAEPLHHWRVGERTLRRVRAGNGCRSAAVGAPLAELLDQPGLADAGLAGHEDELRRARLGGAPEGGQAAPLGGPPDQRWAADAAGWALGCARGASRRQNRLVRLARLG